jgi:hypothetical protein
MSSIVVHSSTQSIKVDPATQAVTVVLAGPQGPAGADGEGGGGGDDDRLPDPTGEPAGKAPVTTGDDEYELITVQAHSAALDAVATNVTVTQPVNLDTIEARVNDLDAAVVLRGAWDASAGTFPGGGTAQAGSSWIVSVGGTVNGQVFVANDRIVAITDNASTGTYAANWLKLDYTDMVLSVDGQTGAVTIVAASTVTAGKVRLATTGETTTGTAVDIGVTPAGLKVVADLKAPLASPAMTGNPTVPTQAPGDNSTKAANTAFVQGEIEGLTEYIDAQIAAALKNVLWVVRYDDDTDTWVNNDGSTRNTDEDIVHWALSPNQPAAPIPTHYNEHGLDMHEPAPEE